MVNGSSSNWSTVLFGTHQGTVPGLILFFSILLMIDIVPSVASSKVKLFVDDCVKGCHDDFKLPSKYNK